MTEQEIRDDERDEIIKYLLTLQRRARTQLVLLRWWNFITARRLIAAAGHTGALAELIAENRHRAE